MKKLLFAPLYLDEGKRFERNIKWLEYYIPLKDKLGYKEILFVDNASTKLPEFEQAIQKYQSSVKITIIKKTLSMTRRTQHAYSYWYRAFANGIKYAMDNGYDVLQHCDTDVFALNDKMVNHIASVETGWLAYWCEMYKYPETTFQIICKDQFQKAYQFMSEDFLEFYPYDIAEFRIPFTHVEKSFNGDRFGEKCLQQAPDMDWFGQTPVETKIVFNMGKK